MKRSHLIIIMLGLVAVTGALLAQSIVTSGRGARLTKHRSYDPRTPPPLDLSDAYALAVGNLARTPGATNRFHCISASTLEMAGSNGWTGWTFWFANTNGQRASMWVFFDGGVTCDVRSAEWFAK